MPPRAERKQSKDSKEKKVVVESLIEQRIPSELLSVIIKYVGFGDACQHVCRVNHSFAEAVNVAYAVEDQNITRGHLVESSGRLLDLLINQCRLIVHDYGLAALSKQAESLLRRERNAHQLRHAGLMHDLMLLNTSVYTNWEPSKHKGHDGIVHILRETAKLNPEKPEMGTAIERDVRYWKGDRLSGQFTVLCERKDGTVLVRAKGKSKGVASKTEISLGSSTSTTNERAYEFYLVLGMAQSIGMALSPVFGFSTEDNPLQLTVHAGPLYGLIIETTLLPWNGRIVYDGLMSPVEQLHKKAMLKMRAEYLHAMDSGEGFFTRLERHELPRSLDAVCATTAATSKGSSASRSSSSSSSSSSSDAGAGTRSNNSPLGGLSTAGQLALAAIKKAPQTPIPSNLQDAEMWVLRRFGYTEEENPSHMVSLISSNSTGPLLSEGFVTLNALAPTVEEVLSIVAKGTAQTKQRPHCVCCDEESIIDALHAALKGANVQVEYYPPPSKEEETYFQRSNPSQQGRRLDGQYRRLCEVCNRKERPDGQSLLVCSRCHDVAYCGKEHQKSDWKRRHKYECVADDA